MFVIDRANKNKVYYVNSKLYSFHKDFVNANYLSLERGAEFFRHNYLESARRFVLGTVAYQTKPQTILSVCRTILLFDRGLLQ